MLNARLELEQLNTALLLAPDGIAGDRRVEELALEDPELRFLSPLLRALYKLTQLSCQPEDAIRALETCWILDDSAVRKPDDWQPWDNVEAVECVEHTIKSRFRGKTIELVLHSEADLLFCSEEYKSLITAASVADLLLDTSDIKTLLLPKELEHWLQQKVEPPLGQAEGEDEPLCVITHQLVSVGGIRVDGPKLIDGYHEISVENCKDNWPQHSKRKAFCWLQALSFLQADQLGIATPDITPGAAESEAETAEPSWGPGMVIPKSAWINANKLQKSYSRGKRLRSSGHPLRLALGCGESWDPRSSCDEDLENETDQSAIFSADHPPVITIDIRANADEKQDVITNLFPYLKQLATLAASAGESQASNQDPKFCGNPTGRSPD